MIRPRTASASTFPYTHSFPSFDLRVRYSFIPQLTSDSAFHVLYPPRRNQIHWIHGSQHAVGALHTETPMNLWANAGVVLTFPLRYLLFTQFRFYSGKESTCCQYTETSKAEGLSYCRKGTAKLQISHNRVFFCPKKGSTGTDSRLHASSFSVSTPKLSLCIRSKYRYRCESSRSCCLA